MTSQIPLDVARPSGWQLLVEIPATNHGRIDLQLADRIAEALQVVSLQPVQFRRIHAALVQAVRRATGAEQPPEQIDEVRIRIWTLGADDHSRSWGFFVVEKQSDDLQSVAVKREHLVELHLYQE